MRPLTLYLMGALYRTSRKSGPRRSREDGLTPADIPEHQASHRNPAIAAAKHQPAKIANECREEGLNTVCQRNHAVKPGERRKQKEKRRKPCRQLTKPFQGKQVDENDRPTACGDAEQHERQVGIMNEVRKQSTAADVKKVPRGVRLVNPWIKVRYAEGEVHRVKIVEFVAIHGVFMVVFCCRNA